MMWILMKSLVGTKADKGKRIVAMPLELCENMAQTHIGKDHKVDWKELELSQKAIHHHSRALCRIFNVGAKGGPRNAARCFNNLSS